MDAWEKLGFWCTVAIVLILATIAVWGTYTWFAPNELIGYRITREEDTSVPVYYVMLVIKNGPDRVALMTTDARDALEFITEAREVGLTDY